MYVSLSEFLAQFGPREVVQALSARIDVRNVTEKALVEYAADPTPQDTTVSKEVREAASLALRSLKEAEELAVGFVAGRYGHLLPLTEATAPGTLKEKTMDLARFKLYRLDPPEHVRENNALALKWLSDVSTGKVVIGLDRAAGRPAAEAVSAVPTVAFGRGGYSRLFTDPEAEGRYLNG